MTDTGQFPERGQLDQPGGPPGQPESPAVPVPAAFPLPEAAEADDRDEEDLLMPGTHSPWGESGTPHRGVPVGYPAGEAAPAAQHAAPPGTPAAGTPVARRPLHQGPPLPEPAGPVRPLADRTPPAGIQLPAPGAQPAPAAGPHPNAPAGAQPAPPAGVQPTPQASAQPLPPANPEYLDMAAGAPQLPEPAAVAQAGHGGLPAQPGAWHPAPAPQPVTADAPPFAEGAAAPASVAPASVAPAAVAPAAVPAAPQPAEAAAPQQPAAEDAAAQPEAAPAPAPEGQAPAPAAPGPVTVPAPREHTGSPEQVQEQEHEPEPEAAAAAEATEPGQPPQHGPGTEGPAPDVAAAGPEPAPEPPADSAPAAHYEAAERDSVHRLMRDHREGQQGFRPDAIPHDVLLRVLEAAHTAPTAGHTQPWDFVIIRSPETRRAVHDLVLRQHESHAKSLTRARAKQLKQPSAEAIVQTPVNIVVTADPTRGGSANLGSGSRQEAAPYSTALAVENLWLAARAEGLTVEWIGFRQEGALVETLGLPAHLEIVAYLCVGYAAGPDEQAAAGAEPAVVARRPLSWVVHEESYGRRALPGAQPHDLLGETLAQIRPLDAQALGEAWERQRRMAKPAGALGALEVIAAQLCGLTRSCPPPVPEPAAVAVFAGDHGVHAQGVTAWPQEVTAQMVANFLAGGAVCNAFAGQVGAEVCVVDVGVRGELPPLAGLMPRKVRQGTADFTAGPALNRDEVLRALEIGIETARDLVAAGNRALLTGEMGVANTTVSAALTAVFTGADPAEVTGRGSGVDDETYARKVAVVRAALELHQPDPADPIAVLEKVGGLEHAALTGLILGGASLRVPVILDGVTAGSAALAARAIAPEAVSACIAGHRSAEPGHLAALTALGLRPLVDLDLRLGEGTGALLALPVVQAAARAMREVATFDSAGITEKG